MPSNKVAAKAQLEFCMITGGSGFLGGNLAKALLKSGAKVRIFDIVEPNFDHDNMEFVKGDLTSFESVKAACEGVDTVFHTAAVIGLMGGPAATKEYCDLSYRINVQGSNNVVEACTEMGVQRLVYTSSNNVCFNGTPNPNMDHTTPYATNLYDMYTSTKQQAEKNILAANGEKGLLTCAIRPAGIYGGEKNYMLDRFVEELASGKIVVRLGNPNGVHDNSFIENLVHGHILAAQAMVEGAAACGNAYFITDDEPMNYWEFFRPFINELGYKFPKIWLPKQLLMPVMVAWQWLHFKGITPPPMLSPKELDKVSVTHFSNSHDARRDLGYEPVKTAAEAAQACMEYVREYHSQLKAK